MDEPNETETPRKKDEERGRKLTHQKFSFGLAAWSHRLSDHQSINLPITKLGCSPSLSTFCDAAVLKPPVTSSAMRVMESSATL